MSYIETAYYKYAKEGIAKSELLAIDSVVEAVEEYSVRHNKTNVEFNTVHRELWNKWKPTSEILYELEALREFASWVKSQ